MSDELMQINPATGEAIQGSVVGIEESRANAESQAGFIVAQRFPRNSQLAMNRILDMCKRESLAEAAAYAYKKGGQTITGPSIRLAEAIAQHWGNIQFGIRELEVLDDKTVMLAYCFDLETNTRAERIFTATHYIKTQKGMKFLEDPREIYEHAFNLGARRLRACILQVVPGDVVEMALNTCKETMSTGKNAPTPANIKKMIETFAEVEVTKDMIEMRQGKKIDALTGPEMVLLRTIYTSIKDGMKPASEWFTEDIQEPRRKEEAKKDEKPKAEPKKKTTKKKTTAKKKTEPKKEEAPAEPPPAPPGDPEEPPWELGQEASPPEQEPAPEPAKPGTFDVHDTIAQVEFAKDGKTKDGRAYKLYNVTLGNGKVLGCFNKELIKKAEEAVDKNFLCEIEYEDRGNFSTLIGLEHLG